MTHPRPAVPLPQRTILTPKLDGPGRVLEAMPGMEACDFCSRVPVTHREKVRPGTVINLPPGNGVSNDDWAACQQCHDLIEAGDWEAVTRLSVREYAKRMKISRNARRAMLPSVRHLHQRVRAAWIGSETL